MVSADEPRRGDIWLVALGAGRSGEPAKTRPAIVVSVDELSTGATEELIVVVPVSSSMAPSALRVELEPAVGIERVSRAVCRALRAVVRSRLLRRIGRVTPANMEQIETTLALILGLESTATVPGRRPPGLATRDRRAPRSAGGAPPREAAQPEPSSQRQSL